MATNKDIRVRKAENKRRELANRSARGQQQATLFINERDLVFLDTFKECLGASSRSEALAILIREYRAQNPLLGLQDPIINNQESKLPSG